MRTADVIDAFLASRGQTRAPETVRFYRARLKTFRDKYGDRELLTLTPLDVLTHLAETGQTASDSTRRHNAVALEQLHAWCTQQGLIPADRPLWGKLDKPPVGLRQRLPTAAETDQILARACPAFVSIYAALRLSGARPGELCGATIADVDLIAGTITRQRHKTARKTGKPRIIPVGAKLAEIVRQAIGDRTAGPVWLAPRGGAWSVPHLSRVYRQLRKAAGLPQELCLYLTRHEAGTRLTKTAGVEAAARILGHASTQTTSRYVHYATAELARLQDLEETSSP